MLIFRQLFDPQSSTYSYLLGDSDSGEAVLIDPVFEQGTARAALVRELELKLLYTLETHVHADHVTGAANLRSHLGSKIALSEAWRAAGADRYLVDRERVILRQALSGGAGHARPYQRLPDLCARRRDHGLHRRLPADPRLRAHRFPAGRSAAPCIARSHTQIFRCRKTVCIYPGHDYRGLTLTSVGEERQFNPRLGGQLSEDDFVGYMSNLGLAASRSRWISRCRPT